MNVVACLYWSGVFKNRENVYTTEWVYILRNMVERHMHTPFRFVCLTNVPNQFDGSVEIIPLQHDWKGWWGKLELFRSDIFDDGDRVLYLDLDSVVLQSLHPFFDFDADIAIMRSLDPKRFGTEWSKAGENMIVRYGSTVMVWTVPHGRKFYTEFDYDEIVLKRKLRGDQDWMAACNPSLALFPVEWVKKLRHIRYKNIRPKDVKILLPMDPGMPLKNKSAAEKYPWIHKAWK